MAFIKSTNPVCNRLGSNFFSFFAQQGGQEGNVPVVDVGKVLTRRKDPIIKVGDIIYITVRFSVPADQAEAITSQNLDTFFKFYSRADERELKVRILADSFEKEEIDESGDGGPVNINIQFEGLLDLADLASGEKVVDLIGYNLSGSRVIEVIVASSDPFYLNQSLADLMQPNIINAGVGEAAEPVREKHFPVGLRPVSFEETSDVKLWRTIRDATNALSFKNYFDFMNIIFCSEGVPIDNDNIFKQELRRLNIRRKLPFNDTEAYRAIKIATEAFVMVNLANSTGDLDGYLESVFDANGERLRIIPYLAIIRNKLSDLDFKSTSFEDALDNFINPNNRPVADTCYGIITDRIQQPIYLELIWSYWHEESMMVQGVNTVARRFQNIKGEGPVDPLANLEIGPLRPLNNLMWGYIQDEQHRLTVRRRAYEYDHHYGITLQGKAVTNMRTADSRSKFIEAFHTLLNLCMRFFRQHDDTTVVADGFPIMNALKEVHMILSEGAHNQYGDLPSTARIEMLMQQYLLARPEFREFLPTRQMVPYPEAWMDRTAVLNQLHGWTKTSVLHFRDLAVFGEQILLSIRFGAWSNVFDRTQAANWAIFWRPQIQNYMHAYRAVTGIDLAREDNAPVDILQPSVHLVRRLKEQNSKMKI